ncbi:hypothetical protein FG379_000115 [Cryptosporidium bovis]|uniref:uncharacterized protein n=1 Tax=Cryptosporidium bovis TaxID=310047 RepID=UPI003519E9AC|nr:hypothetical protein FG379_000115 [Cryptosporidium bovis]
MSNKQLKFSSNVSALRFIQAAQAKVKHNELKKKQEETLGWCLPGYEDMRTTTSELANKDGKLENMLILSRKSFNSFNKNVERANNAIISRRKNLEKKIEESYEEEAIMNMFKGNKKT